MSALLADPKLLWYAARSTGAICLVLLTVTTVLGLVTARRVGSVHWPRFVNQALHRTTALLAVLLLAGHVAVVVLDDYVQIRLLEAFVPFVGTYRPVWLGLGAVATDLLLLVVLTSLVRTRLSLTVWRAVHLTAYACWPVAVLHGLGTGSDARSVWFVALSVTCALGVAGTLLWRLGTASPGSASPGSAVPRLAGGVIALAALVGMALWALDGPMQPGWAARAGTPTTQGDPDG